MPQRQLATVIKDIISIIPNNEEELVGIRTRLTKLKSDLAYQAPELVYWGWVKLANICEDNEEPLLKHNISNIIQTIIQGPLLPVVSE